MYLIWSIFIGVGDNLIHFRIHMLFLQLYNYKRPILIIYGVNNSSKENVNTHLYITQVDMYVPMVDTNNLFRGWGWKC